jgi:hypothetical protein
VRDIDTAVVDSLKALDPEWPIREADIAIALLVPVQVRKVLVNYGTNVLKHERRLLLDAPPCGIAGTAATCCA